MTDTTTDEVTLTETCPIEQARSEASGGADDRTGGCPFTMTTHRPADPAFNDDPIGYYHHLQHLSGDDGLLRWPEGGGWIATTHEAVEEVMLHPQLTTSMAYHPVFGAFIDRDSDDKFFRLMAVSLIGSDLENHKRMRGHVSRALTKMAVGKFAGTVQSLFDDLLTSAIGDAGPGDRVEIDWIEDVAQKFPYLVIAEVLGIPTDRLDEFVPLARHFGATANPDITPEMFDDLRGAVLAFNDLVIDLIAGAEQIPQDDPRQNSLIAQLAGLKNSGVLTEDECSACVITLIAGGIETSINLINNLVITLAEQPDEVSGGLSAEQVPAFVAEAMRQVPVGKQSAARYAIEDLELRGRKIAKGETILPLGAAADVDDMVFDRPRTFDTERENLHRALTFGKGMHRCLGAQLVELEGFVAITGILDRLDQIEVTDVTRGTHPVFHQTTTLKVTATVR